MHLGAKERILMLRLIEKLQKHPDFAKALGIEANGVAKKPDIRTKPKGFTDV